RLDVLRRVVGDFDVELFLEGHHEFDVVQAVGAEVVNEARLFVDLFRVSVEVLDDDLTHALENVGHSAPFPSLMLDARPYQFHQAAARTSTPIWRHPWARQYWLSKIGLPAIMFHSGRPAGEEAPRRRPGDARPDVASRPASPQIIAMPPFTCSVWPVTYAASSLAR